MKRKHDEFFVEKQLSFSWLSIRGRFVGKDLMIDVQGGDIPHIGCCVLAIPRESLTKDGRISVTSSVMNLTGHKDEEICRSVAEFCSKEFHCTVVCAGGFHVDEMTENQIYEVKQAVELLMTEL